MTDFLTQILFPMIRVLYIPFDLLLGWVTRLGPIGALVAAGAVTGFAVNLFQKYFSNQELLGRRKSDLEKLKALTTDSKAAKDEEKAARLTGLTGRISSKYMMESMKPALYSIPPLCILAMWVGTRLSFEPVRPGDVVEVVGTFEDGASGFTHVVPNEGLVPESTAIVPVAIQSPAGADEGNESKRNSSPQASWKIRAEKEGEFALLIRHGEDRYSISVPVHAKGGHPPEQATTFRSESPTRDKLLSVEFKLREPVPSAWWNMKMQAMGIYLIVAMVFGVLLRRVMGIK